MVKAKKFVIRKYFEEYPKPTDFQLAEEELRPIKDGEYLAEAIYLSVDPYARNITHWVPLGSTVPGGQIAKIIESKNPGFPVGKYVAGQFGWRTHTIAQSITPDLISIPTVVLPDLGDLPPSLGLGMLGMPGNTAYFGVLEVCKAKQGETFVVSGAAGAVGSHAGQIAKIIGCTVIGIAGSDEKGKWLTEELGFDHFINYKTQNVKDELKKAAPNGVDCYFDSVGGEISSTVIYQMNYNGRIGVCGAISGYNEKEPPKATSVQLGVLGKQLKMEGFTFAQYNDRWAEAVNQNLKWIREGKLKYKETVTDGFENMPKAFIDMLKGANTGKAIVRV